ncbi:MAG: GGDEF domain-containing protein [Bradyrhizobium sp.]
MLSVPTLWTAFVINFFAMGLIWAYVMRSYPKLEAARFWAASAVIVAVGAVAGIAGIASHALLLLLIAATLTIFATCIAATGIRRFYDQPVSWGQTLLITGLSFAALLFFIVVVDSVKARVAIFSIAQALPFALTLKLLLAPGDGRMTPGARLTGIVTALIVAIHAVRGGATLLGVDFAFSRATDPQAAAVIVLLFLSMSLNFGFLLMAMDRLCSEVAELALLDDLTGVANRRHLVQRLTEECARSDRSDEPFALLVIDLDGFKTINDTHGHATGDACLQHFTLMAQTRLRPGDLLARTGGDEFCIVLPSSTPREGVMIARRVLEVCRRDAEACVGADIPIAVSIGVAQWTRQIGRFSDRLIAAADHALYAAKKEGKNRYAAYDPAPPLAPELEPALRNHA